MSDFIWYLKFHISNAYKCNQRNLYHSAENICYPVLKPINHLKLGWCSYKQVESCTCEAVI